MGLCDIGGGIYFCTRRDVSPVAKAWGREDSLQRRWTWGGEKLSDPRLANTPVPGPRPSLRRVSVDLIKFSHGTLWGLHDVMSQELYWSLCLVRNTLTYAIPTGWRTSWPGSFPSAPHTSFSPKATLPLPSSWAGAERIR